MERLMSWHMASGPWIFDGCCLCGLCCPAWTFPSSIVVTASIDRFIILVHETSCIITLHLVNLLQVGDDMIDNFEQWPHRSFAFYYRVLPSQFLRTISLPAWLWNTGGNVGGIVCCNPSPLYPLALMAYRAMASSASICCGWNVGLRLWEDAQSGNWSTSTPMVLETWGPIPVCSSCKYAAVSKKLHSILSWGRLVMGCHIFIQLISSSTVQFQSMSRRWCLLLPIHFKGFTYILAVHLCLPF